MDNTEAVTILDKARKEDVKLAIELSTGSKVYGKVVNITPYDEWVAEDCKTTIIPTCVVEICREHEGADGMIDRYRETGIVNYVSVDQIANINFHGY